VATEDNVLSSTRVPYGFLTLLISMGWLIRFVKHTMWESLYFLYLLLVSVYKTDTNSDSHLQLIVIKTLLSVYRSSAILIYH